MSILTVYFLTYFDKVILEDNKTLTIMDRNTNEMLYEIKDTVDYEIEEKNIYYNVADSIYKYNFETDEITRIYGKYALSEKENLITLIYITLITSVILGGILIISKFKMNNKSK